jgi:hypothetical protein
MLSVHPLLGTWSEDVDTQTKLGTNPGWCCPFTLGWEPGRRMWTPRLNWVQTRADAVRSPLAGNLVGGLNWIQTRADAVRSPLAGNVVGGCGHPELASCLPFLCFGSIERLVKTWWIHHIQIVWCLFCQQGSGPQEDEDYMAHNCFKPASTEHWKTVVC